MTNNYKKSGVDLAKSDHIKDKLIKDLGIKLDKRGNVEANDI